MRFAILELRVLAAGNERKQHCLDGAGRELAIGIAEGF